MPYFGTQGGGIAVMKDDDLVWREPPVWFDEAKPGDRVPEDWGVVGPFDDATHKPSVDDESPDS